MIRLLAVLPLLLALSCSSPGGPGPSARLSPCDQTSAAARPPDGCGLVCRAEIPVSFSEHSPTVDVWINDQPARMLLDTGADLTVLSPDAVARFGLGAVMPNQGRLLGIGGSQARGTVVVRKLALSYLRRDQLTVSVAKMGGPKGYTPPDGVLGDDVLHDYEVDLDLPHDLVRLYQGRPCEGLLPGWVAEDGSAPFDTARRGHGVVVPVSLDSQATRAMVDTGAEAIVVNRRLALGSGVPAGELTDDLGTKMFGMGPDHVPGNLHRFATLDVGGEHIAPVEAAVIELPFRDPGLIIGEDFLQTHKVWISYATGRVHFAHTW